MPSYAFPLPSYRRPTATQGPLAAYQAANPVPVGTPTGRQWNIVPGVGLVPVGAGNVPAPQGGQGPYGTVPGATTTVDPAALWRTFYPNLQADTSTASGIVRSQMAGELTPEVQRVVTDAAVARGVASGVGGSPFSGSVVARDLGLTTMDLQNQGVSNLNQQLGTFYQNLVGPTTQLSQDNAVLASAPNPAAAAAEQQRVYEEQQQRSFERQQALIDKQFTQQMAYLDKYLKPASSVGGGGYKPKAYGVTYTMPGATTPYSSNIFYR